MAGVSGRVVSRCLGGAACLRDAFVVTRAAVLQLGLGRTELHRDRLRRHRRLRPRRPFGPQRRLGGGERRFQPLEVGRHRRVTGGAQVGLVVQPGAQSVEQLVAHGARRCRRLHRSLRRLARRICLLIRRGERRETFGRRRRLRLRRIRPLPLRLSLLPLELGLALSGLELRQQELLSGALRRPSLLEAGRRRRRRRQLRLTLAARAAQSLLVSLRLLLELSFAGGGTLQRQSRLLALSVGTLHLRFQLTLTLGELSLEAAPRVACLRQLLLRLLGCLLGVGARAQHLRPRRLRLRSRRRQLR